MSLGLGLGLGLHTGRWNDGRVLDLDLVHSRGPAPLGTYTRSTPAMQFDSSGVLGWGAHNWLLRSEEIDNAYWAKVSSSVTDDATSGPFDGFADKLVEAVSGAATHYVARASADFTAGTTYTLSVYAKAAERQWVAVGFANEATRLAWFNLATGVVGTTQASVTSTSIQSVGNGWYRCVVTSTIGTTNPYPCAMIASADGTISYAGDGTSGVYLDGFQLNYGTTALTYVPTTSAAVTNQPRPDYDPATLVKRGWLMEGSRQNVLTYSEDFRDTATAGSARPWVYSAVSVTANAATAPDGTATADKLIGSAVNTIHEVRQLYTVSATSYCASIHLKKGEYNWGFINYYDGTADRQAFFNLDAGTVGTVSAGTTAGITNCGNGWYRCHIVVTGVVASNRFDFGVTDADNSRIKALDATSGIYLWGAQLEAATFPSSYIPTTTTSFSRSADLWTISNAQFLAATGQNIPQAEGTMVLEVNNLYFNASDAASIHGVAAFWDLSTSNFIRVYRYRDRLGVTVTAASTPSADVYLSGFASNSVNKIAITWGASGVNIAVNGVAATRDATIVVPTITGLTFGGGWEPWHHLRRCVIYPTEKTDTEIARLSA